MPELPKGTRYLDPAALARLKNLGLAARLVVEGLFAGQHRSPHRGFAVEFAEHRQYTPGIDLRHLDWKVLAKRDKLYVKQYEEQTNLRGYLVLDASASMGYRHSGPMTKLEYASYLAATLAYLMMVQHDAFGLIVCGDRIRLNIPPRQGRGQLRSVLERLEEVRPEGETDLPRTFHELAERMKRRALVVVISDLFGGAGGGKGGGKGSGSTDDLLDALGHFRHKKHEVVVLQVLDRAELTFPFRDAGQIEDIETHLTIDADAEAIRNHYLQRLNAHLDGVRQGCLARQIGYSMADTGEPFDLFLGTYLMRRQHQHMARTAY
ncbi:MAG: DUF58 domain-containing protein [Planctomycetes bacterium]|nr:DUF58 domain-containing protein [Planctomycetota bacterium]